MANVGHFAGLSIFSPKMWLRLTQNDQFHPIHNFSHLLAPKHLIFGEISKIFIPGDGGTLANILSFSTYLNHFTLEWLKMTLNGKFCQKGDLDWLQKANFYHFAGLSIFSPKMRLRLTWNGQFHPIHKFFHLLPPKCLILGEISKIIIPGQGGTSANILSFSTFLNHFTLEWLKMTLNGKFCQKSDLDWLKMANFGLQVFPSFPPKWGSDWLIMANFTWFTTFPIFCHQSILFLEISEKFSFIGGRVIQHFF